MPERRTHDYVRIALTTLLAAFGVATGKVISALHRRYRAAEFKFSCAGRTGRSARLTLPDHLPSRWEMVTNVQVSSGADALSGLANSVVASWALCACSGTLM
ncbi:hypothetical protein [Streptomyces avermitilis]|uniref:hypothetical protein n=1 Tax=Streptomyces avermitilis TaxID=33903 RepID=UPI003F4BE958